MLSSSLPFGPSVFQSVLSTLSSQFDPWREYDPRVLGTCICLVDHDINFTTGENRQRPCEPLVPSGIPSGKTGRAVDFYPALGLVTPHSTFISSNCRSLTSGRSHSLMPVRKREESCLSLARRWHRSSDSQPLPLASSCALP